MVRTFFDIQRTIVDGKISLNIRVGWSAQFASLASSFVQPPVGFIIKPLSRIILSRGTGKLTNAPINSPVGGRLDAVQLGVQTAPGHEFVV
jgi:hypothetical protein